MILANELLIPLIMMLTICGVVIATLFSKLYKQRSMTKKFKDKHTRELHHRKSSEVRLGKIGENLAPFVKGWPWDPNNFRFLGNPVDGVQFNSDEIIFVEIKTGGARLSKSQKMFKNLVNNGKVSFVTFKITEDGTKLIKEGEVL